jgi:ferredoxin
MPKVYFPNEDRTIEVPYDANLRRAALDNGVNVYAWPHKYMNCGGLGLCGTCRVKVEPEWNLTERTSAEERKLRAAPLRLSCQAKVEGDITCWTQIPQQITRPITQTSCFVVLSVPRMEQVQVVHGNEMQSNVFLDFGEADTIAREIAALYPDGEWEVREYADPLTTQELSYRFTPLRYVRPQPGDMLADGRGKLVLAPAAEASPQGDAPNRLLAARSGEQ